MSVNRNKTAYGLTRSQERAASRFFGKHVTPEKAIVTLVFSLLVSAAPMLLGLRLWNEIPSVVETGLIGPGGEDDSLPRAVLVFGIPGLMCVLNLICHVQLWLHQKAQRVPPASVRLLGRWSLPVISVLLSSFWILRAAGESTDPVFFLPCMLGLLLILSGSHFFDCPPGSRAAFRLASIRYREEAWRKTHRAAGVCWMLAGLIVLLGRFLCTSFPWYSGVAVLALLLSEFPAAAYFART